LVALVIFPILIQPIFVIYLGAIAAAVYLSSVPKSELLNLYLAFLSRWALFVVFSIISLTYIPENTLIALFLLVYLNTTFNPKLVISQHGL
jgi:hypothetical protein